MSRRLIPKLLLPVALLNVGLAMVSWNSPNANDPLGHHPLNYSPIFDVEQAALSYTENRFAVLSPTITVLLARSIVTEDLPRLGLTAIGFGGQEPPLMLVVIRGEFDVRSLRHMIAADSPWRTNYIAYVFDMWAKAPTLIEVSPDGAEFRLLLDYPDFRYDGPSGANRIVPSEVGVPTPLPLAPAVRLPYGAVAPTAIPPFGAPSTTPCAVSRAPGGNQ